MSIVEQMEEAFRLGKGLDPHHPDHVTIHFKDALNRLDGLELLIVCRKDEIREDLITRYFETQRKALQGIGIRVSSGVKMVYKGGDGSIMRTTLRDLHCEDGAVWMVIFRTIGES